MKNNYRPISFMMIHEKILNKMFPILCHQKHKQQQPKKKKKKADKLSFIEVKNIYLKVTIKKVVRQSKEQETITA